MRLSTPASVPVKSATARRFALTFRIPPFDDRYSQKTSGGAHCSYDQPGDHDGGNLGNVNNHIHY
jgi:hypothetical protein